VLTQATRPRYAATFLLPLGVFSLYDQAERELAILRESGDLCESQMWQQMCFCLLSPVTRFEAVRACMQRLEAHRVLNRLAENPRSVRSEEIRRLLSAQDQPCRFPGQKADRLLQAGYFFYEKAPAPGVRGFLRGFPKSLDARKALVDKVPGLGMKEASHFLRNVGHGANLAVLDIHVRRFLAEMRLVGESIAFSNSRVSYLKMERTLLSLAFNSGLEIGALDLAIWGYMRRK
jgi:N-glycosylase/DNA lyase